MARVTVEDCVIKVPNRFDLVLLAAQRARDLSAGADPAVERENDKHPVIALREIAEARVDLEHLRNTLVSGLQKHVEVDEPEDESMAILAAAEREWAGVTGGEAEREAEGDEEAAEAETPEALEDDEEGLAIEEDVFGGEDRGTPDEPDET